MCIFTVNYANASCNVTPDLLVYMQHVTSIYTETRDEARGRGTCVYTCRRTPQAYPAQGLSPAQSPGLPAAPLITNLPPRAPQNWAECCGEAPPCTQPLVVSVDLKLFFHSLFYLLFLTGGLGDSGDTQSGFLPPLRVQEYQLNWLRSSVGLWFEVSVVSLLLH